MKEHLEQKFRVGAQGLAPRQRIDSLHIFQCRHYAMGVGAIPMRAVVEEYLKFRDVVRAPGTHRSAMASVSSCHGLIGLVEVRHV